MVPRAMTHRSSATRAPTKGREVAHEEGGRSRAGSSPTLTPDSPVQATGLVVLTEIRRDNGEAAGRGQGVGVVLAQNPTAAGEGVLAELTGQPVLPHLPQDGGEVVAERRV